MLSREDKLKIRKKWQRGFRAECLPETYKIAKAMMNLEGFTVKIRRLNETGETVWAVIASNENGFWMDAKKTKKEAVRLCKAMEWRIQNDI